MQGKWRVKSSSMTEGGAAFAPLIGSLVTIEDDAMILRESAGVDALGSPVMHEQRKALRVIPNSTPTAVDLLHASPSKGWSRVGIVAVEGDRMRLCVNFPQGPRPASFAAGEDGLELVELERVR